LVVLVLSARENFASRQRIRASWKRGASNVFFLVGNISCDVPATMRKEWMCEAREGEEISPFLSQHHQMLEREVQECLMEETEEDSDVIFLPTKDFHRNLPRKLKDAYGWALRSTNATWFLKADDDMLFVDIPRLQHFLCSLESQESTVVGRVASNVPVDRDGKWAETNYLPAFYPPFCKGAFGHAISRDIASDVVEFDGFEYHGEDVSLGIWLDESPRSNDITWISAAGFQSDADLAEPEAVALLLGTESEREIDELHLCSAAHDLAEHSGTEVRHQSFFAWEPHCIARDSKCWLAAHVALTSSRFDLLVGVVHAFFYFSPAEVPRRVKACSDAIRGVVMGTVSKSLPQDSAANFDPYAGGEASQQEASFDLVQERSSDFVEMWDSLKLMDVQIRGVNLMGAAIALGTNVTTKSLGDLSEYRFDFGVLLEAGISRRMMENVLWIWLTIQPRFASPQARMVFTYSNDTILLNRLRRDVQTKCAVDDAILYECASSLDIDDVAKLSSQVHSDLLFPRGPELIHVRAFFFLARQNLRVCEQAIFDACAEGSLCGCAHLLKNEEVFLQVADIVLNSFPSQSGATNVEQMVPSLEWMPAYTTLSSSKFDLLIETVHAYFFITFRDVPKCVRECSEMVRAFKARAIGGPPLGINRRGLHPDSRGFASAQENFDLSLERSSSFPRFWGLLKSDEVYFAGVDQVAASIVLNLTVTSDVLQDLNGHGFGAQTLLAGEVPRELLQNVLFLWMHIQDELSLPRVRVLSVLVDQQDLQSRLKEVVESECSADGEVLYEHFIHLNDRGASAFSKLLWPAVPPDQAQDVGGDLRKLLFFFFFSKSDAGPCSDAMRMVCAEFSMKRCAHLSDDQHGDLEVAQTVLNSNSLTYLQYGSGCDDAVRRWGSSSGGMKSLLRESSHVGTPTFMVDSGSVLQWHGIRAARDTDIVVFSPLSQELIAAIYVDQVGINFIWDQQHDGTHSNWGRFHLDGDNLRLIDFFFDPTLFGMCSGVKFVSLERVKMYKKRRNEYPKDPSDVHKIDNFLFVHKKCEACDEFRKRSQRVSLTSLHGTNIYEDFRNGEDGPAQRVVFQDLDRRGFDNLETFEASLKLGVNFKIFGRYWLIEKNTSFEKEVLSRPGAKPFPNNDPRLFYDYNLEKSIGHFQKLSEISERQNWDETTGSTRTKLSADSAQNVKSCVTQPVTSYMDFRFVQNLTFSLPLLSQVSGDTFRLGYCHPFLLCPVTVPLAYQEIPKNGCSTLKRYMHELDGLNWTSHAETKHVCCKEGKNRVKVLITRNPYSRLVSMFVNLVLKGHARTATRSVILQRFGEFVDQIIRTDDTDEGGWDNHFRSQHYFDDWSRTEQIAGKPLAKDWQGLQGLNMVLKLEELGKFGFSSVEKRLCSELGYCGALPPLPLATGADVKLGHRSPSRGGFLTAQHLFRQNRSWALLIAKRYATDFSLYGYSSWLDQI
jgi:hypothetical protein